LAGAIVRLTVDYDREWDALIDEPALRLLTETAFEFHLIKRPRFGSRIRLPTNQAISSLTPMELLDQFWHTSHVLDNETEELQKLAKEIIEEGT
jgi:hypothetical protein